MAAMSAMGSLRDDVGRPTLPAARLHEGCDADPGRASWLQGSFESPRGSSPARLQ
jgi:hypothetical protein